MAKEIQDRVFDFVIRIIHLCKELDKHPGIPRTMSNQLLKSGTSIGANLEEGQGSQSPTDFIHTLSIANKVARETQYWLKLIAKSGTLHPDLLKDIIKEAGEIVGILTSIIVNTKSKTKN